MQLSSISLCIGAQGHMCGYCPLWYSMQETRPYVCLLSTVTQHARADLTCKKSLGIIVCAVVAVLVIFGILDVTFCLFSAYLQLKNGEGHVVLAPTQYFVSNFLSCQLVITWWNFLPYLIHLWSLLAFLVLLHLILIIVRSYMSIWVIWRAASFTPSSLAFRAMSFSCFLDFVPYLPRDMKLYLVLKNWWDCWIGCITSHQLNPFNHCTGLVELGVRNSQADIAYDSVDIINSLSADAEMGASLVEASMNFLMLPFLWIAKLVSSFKFSLNCLSIELEARVPRCMTIF